jgi:hypothetical protein
VPVGDVLVCDTRGDIEHDDTALSIDVVSIAETAELLLTCRVPDVELDGAEVLLSRQYVVSRGGTDRERTVVKPRGWTSTPSVAMYFFSNSPVKWRLTKVVWRGVSDVCGQSSAYRAKGLHGQNAIARAGRSRFLTFPVPPSPTSTSLKVGTPPCWAVSAMLESVVAGCCVGVCVLRKH